MILVRTFPTVLIALAVAVTFGIVGPIAHAAEAASEPLKLTLGTEYLVRPRSDITSLPIPVIPRKDLGPEMIELAVESVRQNKLLDDMLVKAFYVEPRHVVANGVGAATIPLKMKGQLAQGTYDVVIRARTNNATESALQSLQLKIQVPAASLRTASELVIERVIRLDGKISVSSQPLIISEIGELVSVLDGRFRNADARQRAGNSPVFEAFNGIIAGPSEPIRIPAGGTVQTSLTPTGAFPVGATVFPMELASAQLVQPLPISVKVLTRHTREWIAVLTAMGIAVGWLVRTGLKDRAERNRLQIHALEMVKQLEDELANIVDRIYGQRANQIKAALVKSASRDELPPDEISSTTTKAKDDWDAAHADLQKRAAEASSSLASWHRAIGPSWSVSATVAALLADARNTLRLAARELESLDAAEATDLIGQMQARLSQGLSDAVASWRNDLQLHLEQVLAHAGDYPQPVAERLKQEASRLIPALPAAPGAGTDWTPDVVRDMFTGIDASCRQLSAMRVRLCAEVQQVFVDMARQFDGIQAGGLSARRLLSYAEEFVAAIQRTSEEAWVALAASKQADMRKAAQAVLAAPLAAEDGATRQAIDAQLAAGQFVDAARTLAQALRSAPAVPLPQSAFRMEPELAERPRRPAMLLPIAGAGSERPIEALTAYPRVALAKTPAVMLADARSASTWTAAMQWLVVYGLAVGMAYLTFGDGYSGSPRELVGIFLWAFSIDISINAITTKIQGLKFNNRLFQSTALTSTR